MRIRRYAGFTLIEVMITVAIVAILAAVALPSYQEHIRKSNRRAAQSAMQDIANRQQQFLLANRGYATKTQIEAAGYSLPTEVVGKYTWDVAVSNTASPPTFTITFTAAGGQTADGNLTLDQQGTKGPTGKW